MSRAIPKQPAAGARLSARLESGAAIVMDGATGTELERRGIDTGLPLWSARALVEAPDVVREIHLDYARAGAELLTANSFRTQRRTLAQAGLATRAAELTALAVTLAREARDEAAGRGFVAGSAPTLEDCYRPDLVPDEGALEREHGEHALQLARAGADLILVETMNTLREARAATRAAAATGLPRMVSFVSWQSGTLLSGEPLARALEAVAAFEPAAVLVNCLPPSAVTACLPVLRASDLPFGVYANLGEPSDGQGPPRSEDTSPDEFARHADAWMASGARLVGGCCGTTPAHIGALARAVRQAG